MLFAPADGYAGATFDFTLTINSVVTPAPTPNPTPQPTLAPAPPIDPSDGCAFAAFVDYPGSITGTTSSAPVYSALQCGGARAFDAAGRWYSISGIGQQVVVSTCDFATYDTQISVWTGDCGSLVCVAGNDDSCGLRSRVSWFAVNAQTYYIFVCKLLNAKQRSMHLLGFLNLVFVLIHSLM